ncbi:ABC transporter permease [Mucilaginibacter aurantiaciroseus]|uniref:ABC transporter permease n=1 Tax=Mucilaginibacter aurantiaciroseus TaxID=2949308 RepID=UPI0035160E40
MFILLIAFINFMNLSTAQAAGHVKEVGIRKVLESDKAPLLSQFLIGSFTTSCLAVILASAFSYLTIGIRYGCSMDYKVKSKYLLTAFCK